MNPESIPKRVSSKAPESEAHTPEQNRRGFLKSMSALLLANSGAGEIVSAVTAGTTSPSLSALTPEISKVMGALQRNFEIEKKIKSLGDAHRVFQLVRGKIADEFTIIDGVPTLNPGSLERCAGMTVRGLRDTLFSLLEERKGVICI